MHKCKPIIGKHLHELCCKIGSRPLGTLNNHKAEAYIAGVFKELGLQVDMQEYACKSWEYSEVEFLFESENIPAVVNTYSNSCDIKVAFRTAGNIFELDNGDFKDKIAVIYGELTQVPLAAKSNSIYNPEEHKRIVGLLETKKPLAVIAVSHRATNPVPIIEDWDFEIPSITISTIDGMRLLKNPEGELKLRIKSEFEASHATNIVGKFGKNGKVYGKSKKAKLILCAHLDTKYGTVGSSDNASGIAVLLTIAELLRNESLPTKCLSEGTLPEEKSSFKNMSVEKISIDKLPIDIEFVAFNGEEYYALGEMLYTEKNLQNFENMIAAINFDSIGHYSSTSNIAFFECSEKFIEDAINLKERYPGIIKVDPWPAGDHTFFWTKKVPSIAISSTGTYNLFHTVDDKFDFISIDKIEEVVEFTLNLVMHIIKSQFKSKKISSSKINYQT
jgi:Iap family predicted aminopeptidase